MPKELTITLSDRLYNALRREVPADSLNRCFEDLLSARFLVDPIAVAPSWAASEKSSWEAEVAAVPDSMWDAGGAVQRGHSGLSDAELEAGYRAAAADTAQEAEAKEWCEAVIGDFHFEDEEFEL